MGAEIDRDYPAGNLHLICILKGACFFMSDLARALHIDAFVDFMGISSYGKGKSSSGEVKVTKDLDFSVEGADLLIVEDIVDSGVTLTYLIRIPDEFVVGYGLDYAERYRNLRDICILDNVEGGL